ncbi:uncharacterized protein LOC111374878 [Olea europaea var. sylvestris]|uniref:uncharacterized protein LOC111374878 n=1 Tax=Olea europaea var. sylvestris TaxID=158386 RepID=UPI000C1CE9B3|nr:uncharacterized protein LOC111374878 [Olea europaea var. sylvestris]
MPTSLRRLFASLLTLCNPNHPKLLWDKFKVYMIDDYVCKNIPLGVAEVRALQDINSILELSGQNINHYEIVLFGVNIDENERLRRMVAEETINLDIKGGYARAASLNNEQQFAYDTIMEKVNSKSNGVFSIDVSSGVSVSLLPRGRTTHSRFKIPLKTVGKVSCSLIIWNEAPMVNRCAVEAVAKMLRDITDCNLPFGEKVPLYSHLPLVENIRAKLDPIFCDYLLKVGNGTEQEHSCNCIQLPNNIIIPFEDEITSLKILINHVFLNIEAYVDNLHMTGNRVILTLRNECVDPINRILLDQIPSEIHIYYSFDEAIDKSEQSL